MNASDLLFITNASLRKKIINAIDTISALYIVEQDSKYPEVLSKEIRRIIILYSASIIEALLLYLYKRKGDQMLKIEYKNVSPLPKEFQKENPPSFMIVKQVKVPRLEREMMLDILLDFYIKKNIISQTLEAKIKKAKDIRNTFHLSKSRTGLMVSTRAIQESGEAVYETINLVKREL